MKLKELVTEILEEIEYPERESAIEMLADMSCDIDNCTNDVIGIVSVDFEIKRNVCGYHWQAVKEVMAIIKEKGSK